MVEGCVGETFGSELYSKPPLFSISLVSVQEERHTSQSSLMKLFLVIERKREILFVYIKKFGWKEDVLKFLFIGHQGCVNVTSVKTTIFF